MRIERLRMIAYGPFTSAELSFDHPGSDFHLVYGPNEAGKSSTLRALLGMLFGIPARTADDFQHPYADLRIGASIDFEGRSVDLVRRKGNVKTLRLAGSEETPFSDEEWATLLPVNSEDHFKQLFGIDYARLIDGGKLLASGEGEFGATLFAASAGLQHLFSVQAGLRAEADATFKKRGKSKLKEAIAEHAKYQAEYRRAANTSATLRQLRQDLAEAESESKRCGEEARLADQESKRMNRLGQAIPLLGERRRLHDELDRFQHTPGLDEGFEARYRDARERLRVAEAEIERLGADIDRLQEELERRKPNPDLLKHKDWLGDLNQRSGQIRKATNDRERLVGKTRSSTQQAEEHLRDLGVDVPITEAPALFLAEPERARITQVSNRKSGVDVEEAKAARALKDVTGELERVRRDLAATPVPPDSSVLESLIAGLPPGEKLEADLSARLQSLEKQRKTVDRGLSRLPLWRGSIDQLDTSPLPLEETVEDYQQRFQQQDASEKECEKRIGNLNKELKSVKGRLKKLSAKGDVPTEAELTAARDHRDTVWGSVKQSWLRREDVAGGPDALAASFEGAVAGSDHISDRLRSEADRVADKALNLADREVNEQKLEELQSEREELARSGSALSAEWNQQWAALGADPRTPREMLGWLRKREALLQLWHDLRTEEAALESATAKQKDARAALSTELQRLGLQQSGEPEASLTQLAARARTALADWAEARQARADLERDRLRLEDSLRHATETLQAAKQGREDWQREWAAAIERLPVDPAATPEEVAVAVDLIGKLSAALRDRQDFDRRVATITRDERQFSADVEELGALIAPDLAGEKPLSAVGELNGRLEQALSDQSVHDANRDTLKTKQASLEEEKTKLLNQQKELEFLCSEAGVDDWQQLPAVIEESRQMRSLQSELASRERNLSAFTAGGTIEDLEREADGLNVDEIPGRLTELEQSLAPLEDRKKEADQLTGSLRRELQAMEKEQSAVRAAENAEFALGRIRTQAAEAIKLRLASHLLEKAIERYREKNEEPLIRDAGGRFAVLTCGSFSGLKVDIDEKGQPRLTGIRASNGKLVGVAGMSDATRDQLFLALRMAYVSQYCGNSRPVPFIADDVLISFDDERAAATLKALSELAAKTQVLLFTHHDHLVNLARRELGADTFRLHSLAAVQDR